MRRWRATWRTQGWVPVTPHNVAVAAHGEKFLVNMIVGDSDNVPLKDAQLDDRAAKVAFGVGRAGNLPAIAPPAAMRSCEIVS